MAPKRTDLYTASSDRFVFEMIESWYGVRYKNEEQKKKSMIGILNHSLNWNTWFYDEESEPKKERFSHLMTSLV